MSACRRPIRPTILRRGSKSISAAVGTCSIRATMRRGPGAPSSRGAATLRTCRYPIPSVREPCRGFASGPMRCRQRERSGARRRCRRDLHGDFHGQVIRSGAEPRALQRNGLARVMRDRDADEFFIADDASRRIEVDPARARNIDLDPGVGIAAGGTIVVIIIGQMQISGHEASSDAAGAQRRYHEHGKVTTTAAAEIERADGRLDTLLVPRDVLEGPLDGPRHVAEQLVRVGRAVFAEERSAPAIDRRMRRQRLDEKFETGEIVRRVGKRIGAGTIRYIGGAKAGRRMVETNSADKAQLAGPAAKMSGRHVIAEAVPRPGQLLRAGRDFELCLNHPLIVVVAWTQHHPVLAECDRLMIAIGRDVPDAENRHCRPKIMDAPATSIAAAILSTTCTSWATARERMAAGVTLSGLWFTKRHGDPSVAAAFFLDFSDEDLADFTRRPHVSAAARLNVHSQNLDDAHRVANFRRSRKCRTDQSRPRAYFADRPVQYLDGHILLDYFIDPCRQFDFVERVLFKVKIETRMVGMNGAAGYWGIDETAENVKTRLHLHVVITPLPVDFHPDGLTLQV